jgi:hypothetical protein
MTFDEKTSVGRPASGPADAQPGITHGLCLPAGGQAQTVRHKIR